MAKILENDDMIDKLDAHIAANYGTQSTAAKCWGLTPAAVTHYLSGNRAIPEFIIDEMGYELLVTYRKKRKGK